MEPAIEQESQDCMMFFFANVVTLSLYYIFKFHKYNHLVNSFNVCRLVYIISIHTVMAIKKLMEVWNLYFKQVSLGNFVFISRYTWKWDITSYLLIIKNGLNIHMPYICRIYVYLHTQAHTRTYITGFGTSVSEDLNLKI